eukprot:IDg8359t1
MQHEHHCNAEFLYVFDAFSLQCCREPLHVAAVLTVIKYLRSIRSVRSPRFRPTVYSKRRSGVFTTTLLSLSHLSLRRFDDHYRCRNRQSQPTENIRVAFGQPFCTRFQLLVSLL